MHPTLLHRRGRVRAAAVIGWVIAPLLCSTSIGQSVGTRSAVIGGPRLGPNNNAPDAPALILPGGVTLPR